MAQFLRGAWSATADAAVLVISVDLATREHFARNQASPMLRQPSAANATANHLRRVVSGTIRGQALRSTRRLCSSSNEGVGGAVGSKKAVGSGKSLMGSRARGGSKHADAYTEELESGDVRRNSALSQVWRNSLTSQPLHRC